MAPRRLSTAALAPVALGNRFIDKTLVDIQDAFCRMQERLVARAPIQCLDLDVVQSSGQGAVAQLVEKRLQAGNFWILIFHGRHEA